MTTLVQGTTTDDTLTRDALTVLQPGFDGTRAPDWLLRRVGEGLAAVGLFGRNVADPAQVAALTAELRAENPDVLVAIDEESGDVTRLEVHTGSSFPGNHALGAVDDPALTREVAYALGRRLAECGVDFNWAPSADVNSDPGNPVIGVRSFGSDPALVARHTVAYIEGMQAAGVVACTKHFPGHGDTNVDSHLAMPRIDADLDTLRSRELTPFRAAIEAGSLAVMSAHILLPALDPDRPATLSPRILTGLLREELGYQGLIVTDGMEMQAISAVYGIERGSVLAVAAGADALCVGGGLNDEDTVLRLRDALVTAVRTGELAEERLADAAARVRALASWTRSHRSGSPQTEPGAASATGAAPARTVGGVAPGSNTPADDGGTGFRADVGLVAARRALAVTGAAPAPTGPLHVAALAAEANIAVGDETPWGLGPDLARLVPGSSTAAYGPETPAERLLADAGDRRIVVAVRDAHRHPWMTAVLDGVLAARPDTVVVEMGLNQSPPRGALHIATHGAARVCATAAAEVVARGV
ncbi:glycoside hydrolase family 3 protein [Streptomyces sp. ODS05-4]|uniref:glycoside hydrolase family 3 protein n=1 Tax=Streptomyces sp. ODS05-4 TaxID=2944939 RepID=UPI0021098DB2|nr:glycoside hydrolase family 3 protein [Streptomyces sp. ODS05-4]